MAHSLLKLISCLAFGLSGAACGSGSSPNTGGVSGGALGDAGGSIANASAGTSAGGGSAGGVAGSSASGGSSGSSTAEAGAIGAAGLGGAAGAGSTLALPTFPFPSLIDGCDIPAAQANADTALGATLSNFWSGADQYLRATSPTDGSLTGYWTYAQILDAVLDGVERTGGQRFSGLIRAFYEGQAAHGWLDDYYDDETWLTLALMRAFDLTGDAMYLNTAEMIYKDVMTQWDTTCCAPHLGGIWWDKKKTQKATASNAGPALAGVRLASRTGNTSYLDFAKQVYAFWLSDMVDQTTFAIYDHLNLDGTRGAGSLTYNHGLMMAAALELNAATGDEEYLTEANGFGGYMITHATRTSSAGPVLFDGSPCTGDCAAWKGIGYRYLAELYRHDPTRADYRNVLVSGATAVWTLARDPATNFFSSIWSGPAPTSGGVEAQGSGTMALNLYAMLCGTDLTAAPPPPGVYQAEEGWLDHVDFEATPGRGFIGLGYVSAFTKDKQGVTIDVEVAKAGTYSIAWRYTAGEGAGSRVVLVNGQALAQAQAFPATSSWNDWETAQSSASLPAGKSSIGLFFDATKGSKTSLDIDQLTVTSM